MAGVDYQRLERQEKDDYNEYLSQLIKCDEITDATLVGITKQVIARGVDSLSSNQTYRFKNDVVENFPQPECLRCSELIPFSEAIEYLHGDTLCGSCQHTWDKMEAE